VVTGVDCNKTPDDPKCPSNTLKSTATKEGVDDSCQFFPEQEKCKPDPVTGDCPPGFATNGDGQCYKTGPCPKGFENHDEDESGTCWPKTPKTPCPPNSHRVGNHCEPDCPKGTTSARRANKGILDLDYRKAYRSGQRLDIR
jgi:hypothetical protein